MNIEQEYHGMGVQEYAKSLRGLTSYHAFNQLLGFAVTAESRHLSEVRTLENTLAYVRIELGNLIEHGPLPVKWVEDREPVDVIMEKLREIHAVMGK